MQMTRTVIGAIALVLGATAPGMAQSLDDLNIQIHGYATQGFLYTSRNNILTTSSSDGSPAWTEAVVNIGAKPTPGLRVGVQARYFLLGNFGNQITLDWAAADYTASERFGVRFGKVKTPSGLFNDVQDIDPSYIWSLLPQNIYPISSRNSILSHYGGVAYGTLNLGQKFGKLDYRAWAGERVLRSDDGYFLSGSEQGVTFPNGISGVITGEALHWRTPLHGLMVGVSDTRANASSAKISMSSASGSTTASGGSKLAHSPDFFARYEKGNLMLAAEYTRLIPHPIFIIPGQPAVSTASTDYRDWFGMASYRVTDKFTPGLYVSQSFNHQFGNNKAKWGPQRFSKDWAVSMRYDFNQFLYAKAEQHFIDGTLIGYDSDLNSGGLKADTRLSILKIGVSF